MKTHFDAHPFHWSIYPDRKHAPGDYLILNVALKGLLLEGVGAKVDKPLRFVVDSVTTDYTTDQVRIGLSFAPNVKKLTTGPERLQQLFDEGYRP